MELDSNFFYHAVSHIIGFDFLWNRTDTFFSPFSLPRRWSRIRLHFPPFFALFYRVDRVDSFLFFFLFFSPPIFFGSDIYFFFFSAVFFSPFIFWIGQVLVFFRPFFARLVFADEFFSVCFALFFIGQSCFFSFFRPVFFRTVFFAHGFLRMMEVPLIFYVFFTTPCYI